MNNLFYLLIVAVISTASGYFMARRILWRSTHQQERFDEIQRNIAEGNRAAREGLRLRFGSRGFDAIGAERTFDLLDAMSSFVFSLTFTTLGLILLFHPDGYFRSGPVIVSAKSMGLFVGQIICFSLVGSSLFLRLLQRGKK